MTAHIKPNAKTQTEAPVQSAMAPLAAPAMMAALTAKSIELSLQRWRDIADLSRAVIRAQQDAWLAAWRTGAAQESEAQTASPPAWTTGRTFLFPAMSAFKSYEQMSAVVLQAQRNALASMSGDAESAEIKPH